MRDGLTFQGLFEPIWFSLCARSDVSGDRRTLGEQILYVARAPAEKELSEAAALLEPFLDTIKTARENSFLARSAIFQSEAGWRWFSFAVISMWCALLFRGGLLLHGLGIAVVTKTGCEASRMRMLWRSFITWSPLLLIHLLIYERVLIWGVSGPLWLIWAAMILFIAGAVWAVVKPDRGLPDRIAGTWLVPR